ncbi:MAG: hypothetical protein KC464_29815, partial [Myxococcales bacterium]|nr:hypothetical protein [Myxococcales bacterium]
TLRRALGWGALGAAAAAAVTLALRAAVGDHLPAFIPAEESAGPGLAQGLAAGVGEELVFRLGVAAAVYLTLARRLPRAAAIAAAAIVTGAMFALAHELPPAGGSFALDHVVTRALIPGAAMTAAFLVVHPAFLVAAHAAAHLLIPFLFR